ncbi:MAG: hypothetical protein EAX86_12525 [Candidatus Heimdallarchaeota archaeon]|nr:hypothetical protein [Candidatus Heimdallarchaeota archaeon]
MVTAMETEVKEQINAGRILVVGTQAGGKTAFVTQLAARTEHDTKYREDFGGTIETEYFKVSYRQDSFFGLLLPIGGQEKWHTLRERFGATAEGAIVIVDASTKGFWENSLEQIINISKVIPYKNFPLGIIVTKRDLNERLKEETPKIAEKICETIAKASECSIDYYSRGFHIIPRHLKLSSYKISFTQLEQVIVNSLEQEYFSELVPGNARLGKRKLPELSLVNARIFARALAIALMGSDLSLDQLALLNDMRPTMLELDASWNRLQKLYPKAGDEPQMVIEKITSSLIETVIYERLLAQEADILQFTHKINDLSSKTEWLCLGSKYINVFDFKDINEAASFVENLLLATGDNIPEEKYSILDPITPLF